MEKIETLQHNIGNLHNTIASAVGLKKKERIINIIQLAYLKFQFILRVIDINLISNYLFGPKLQNRGIYY